MGKLTLGFLLCLAGCAPARNDPASLTTNSSEAVAEPSPRLVRLRRLLDTPATSNLARPTESVGKIVALPVPTPEEWANDGRKYTLQIDREAEIAWITVSGGIADHIRETAGPWRLSHPDVVALMAELPDGDRVTD